MVVIRVFPHSDGMDVLQRMPLDHLSVLVHKVQEDAKDKPTDEIDDGFWDFVNFWVDVDNDAHLTSPRSIWQEADYPT